MRERGVDVRVALFGDGPFQERLHAEGFDTSVLPLPRALRRGTRYSAGPSQTLTMIASGVPAVFRLAAMLRRERVDVVHTNGAKAHLIGGLAGRIAGCHVVWHVRDFPLPDAAGRLFGYALRHFPDMVIANSGAVADSLRALAARPDRLLVVANPVNLDLLTRPLDKADARTALGLPRDAPIVGMVAHLTPWKGHERFLEIARRVRQAVPAARFVIAGGSIYETDGHDDYVERLRRLARELNVDDAVTFLGHCREIAPVLAALDVLVHCPTAPEPFGRVLAEAMAAARPVVAARCGGIPEVVRDGETGLLVGADDVSEFTRQIVRVLEQPDLAASLGRAGRRHAASHFAVDVHSALVLGAYERVLAGAPAASAA